MIGTCCLGTRGSVHSSWVVAKGAGTLVSTGDFWGLVSTQHFDDMPTTRQTGLLPSSR